MFTLFSMYVGNEMMIIIYNRLDDVKTANGLQIGAFFRPERAVDPQLMLDFEISFSSSFSEQMFFDVNSANKHMRVQ